MLELKKNLMSKKRVHYPSEGRIENTVLPDHHLSSICKPRDAKRRSSEWIFLSYPHTHDRFIYCLRCIKDYLKILGICCSW